MEISEQELRRLVADADEQHRASLSTLADDLAELHLGEGRTTTSTDGSRRNFLRRLAMGGAAVAIGTAVVPVADLISPAIAAAAAVDAPKDTDLVVFSESVELAFVTAYNEAAVLAVSSAPSVKSAFTTFAGHHQQHAAAFGALANRLSANSKHQANAKLLDVARGQFHAARDQNHALDIGFLLEQSAAATYMVALSTLKNVEGQKLMASILPVESQHATTFGVARGRTLKDTIPTFITVDHALDATKYTVS